MSSNVHHNPAASQFEMSTPQGLAVCCYRLAAGLLVVHHTEVPAALQGRGVAAELVQALLAWAAAQGLRVQPRCSYVAAYMRRHPETLNLLDHPGVRT